MNNFETPQNAQLEDRREKLNLENQLFPYGNVSQTFSN